MRSETAAAVAGDGPDGGAARTADTALPVKGVVFDMDGLLLNTELLAREGLRLAGSEVGLPMTEVFCQSLIGVPADGCRQLLLEYFGNEAPADLFFAAATRHLHVQIDQGLMRLKTGVPELLDYLDRMALPRALATSSARMKAHHHLEAVGIATRFDAIVTRDDVARGKPFPDLYLQAARELGFRPRDCVALEDSYNGVRAAAAAGMPVLMIPDLLPPTPEMERLCTAVHPDLHGVIAWLERSMASTPT
jgi:HAD superfamily hydrolase (TIGR01509 family)